MPTATALTIRFCWRPDRSGGDGCGLTVSGLADTFQVVGEFRTENQFWSPTFLCGFDKLEDHGPWRCWPRIPSGIRASAAAAGRDRAVWPDPTRPPGCRASTVSTGCAYRGVPSKFGYLASSAARPNAESSTGHEETVSSNADRRGAKTGQMPLLLRQQCHGACPSRNCVRYAREAARFFRHLV